jgi:hypothetical protein
MRRGWTPVRNEDVEPIGAMYERGMGPAAIAKDTGYNVRRVREAVEASGREIRPSSAAGGAGKARAAKRKAEAESDKPRPDADPEIVARAVRMYEEDGASMRVIQRQMGLTEYWVRRILSRAGVTMRGRGGRGPKDTRSRCPVCEVVLSETALIDDEGRVLIPADADDAPMCRYCREDKARLWRKMGAVEVWEQMEVAA